MPKGRLRNPSVDDAGFDAGDLDFLREVCPCRNRVLDLEVWREVFATLRSGDRKQRHRAAHAVATLLEKGQASAKWREVVRHFAEEIEAVQEDPVAFGELVGQVGHQAGHARNLRGSATNTFRQQRRILGLASAEELVEWINGELGLRKSEGVSAKHAGVDRLWRWLSHRTQFQRRRRVSEAELRARAMQWLPEHADRLLNAGSASGVGRS